MRILLDECVDRRLARELEAYQVRTVPDVGWASLKTGQLLTRAQDEYDVFITIDKNLAFQQNTLSFSIAVIVLVARSHRVTDLRLLVPQLLTVLPTVKLGAVAVVSQSAEA